MLPCRQRPIARQDERTVVAPRAARTGRDIADMPVLASYIEGVPKLMTMPLKENFELKATALDDLNGHSGDMPC